MQVQEQVQELQEQELPLQEAPLQGQAVLLLLAKVREQVLQLEVLLRAQAGVLAQVEAEVLDLALGVGLQQVVLEQGQVVLAKAQVEVQAQGLEMVQVESLEQGKE